MSHERLVERVADWQTTGVEVDRAARRILNVALVGTQSRNGYAYSPSALQQGAALYEGKPVFLDHAPRGERPTDRSMRDLAGTIRTPRFEGTRIRADIETLDTEAGQTLLALAESRTSAVGMSHVVQARKSHDGRLVEELVDVISVDAVTFPATTNGFQEQTTSEAETTLDLAELQAEVELLREACATWREQSQLWEQRFQRQCSDLEIDRLLRESQLPESSINERFRSQLRAASPEQRPDLIRERCELVELLQRKPPVSRDRHQVVAGTDESAFIAAVCGTRRNIR